MTNHRLVAIHLDDKGLPAPTPEVEQERKVAIFDLLEENSFAPVLRDGDAANGPFELDLAIRDGRLVMAIREEEGDGRSELHLSLSPFRQIIRDYFAICESYYDAVKRLPPSQIEAIDMGRRGIHNAGAELLTERLEGKIKLDNDTARRLFTLICVLQFKG